MASSRLFIRGTAATALVLLAASCATGRDAAKRNLGFEFSENKLTVRTNQMVLAIEGGAIVFARSQDSGEAFVETSAYANRPSDFRSFVGFTSTDSEASLHLRWPTASSSVSFDGTDDYRGRLTYSPLSSDGQPNNSQLIIDVRVDPKTGEVVVQLTGIESDPALKPASVALPIMNTTTPSVILGSGAEYSRDDPDVSDQSSYGHLGFHAPAMAVLRGPESSLAVWSESTDFAPELIRLDHKPGYDQIVLHAEQDPKQTDRQRIVSPPWRVGLYPSWERSAKRWRETFEERTGAKPLWENRALWVRKVHAVFYALGQDYDAEPQKFAELAEKVPPEEVLYFVWNGDRIVLYGDHRLIAGAPRPTPGEADAVLKFGWPLQLFHPHVLIYSEVGAQARLAYLVQRGWLPPGYQFSPDYVGASADWQGYWADVKADYFDGSQFSVLHPGAARFRDYLVRNLKDYCALYGANGVYLDILGDVNEYFSGSQEVIDAQDFALGEARALDRLTRELPQVALMSEYQSPWVLPYAYYSWEGSVQHLKSVQTVHTRINHPLRTALIGSYSWTQESNSESVDDVVAALVGTLPQISLVGDEGVSAERALWSQARAKLFCDRELFNDVPDRWDADALAYYRSNTGNWFKFKRIGSSYGYVEILPSGLEAVRLVK